MSPFVEQLLSEFTRPLPKADLGDECLAAEEAILKFRDTGEGDPEIVPELVDVDLSAEDISALASALRTFIVSHPSHEWVGAAIWAMSKLNDVQLIPFFMEQIRLHYSARREHPVSQADYALCRLGHDTPFNYWSEDRTTENYWLAVEQFLMRHQQT
jgi:hypothetical protein